MKKLEEFLAESLARPVPREIRAMADHVRSHHPGTVAVLAYGSCLRGTPATESLIDFYVLTADLEGVSTNPVSRLACRLLPPNVYYAEHDFEGHRYRAKYACLPLQMFAAKMTVANPYFWARFSQPSALLYATGRDAVIEAIIRAARTMHGRALALRPNGDALSTWVAGFAATYATELRAESGEERARSLVAADEAYYRQLAALMADATPIHASWPLRRFTGKLWSIARLLKAAFTFSGGADYLAWKIERHSGQKIELSPWQRNHPIIAGLLLLPQLLKRGAVR